MCLHHGKDCNILCWYIILVFVVILGPTDIGNNLHIDHGTMCIWYIGISLILLQQYIRIDVLFVICAGLQNDHKSIMKLIEEKIHQLHEEARRHKVASEGKQLVIFYSYGYAVLIINHTSGS